MALQLLASRCLVPAAVSACALVGATTAAAQTVDLYPIFAPPTPAEVQAVRTDWAARPLVVDGYQVETTFVDPNNGSRFDVVSHLVEGDRHYGAIRYPSNYTPGGKYPTLVICHGGVQGALIEEVANLFVAFPGLCVEDDFFMVIPGYRGESLSSPSAGIFPSGGTQSWADRDVDDTRALLSAALDNQPDMDRARIAAWGISRGGCVALLLAARDDRVRRVVDLFGFTDLSLPTVVARVDAIVNRGVTPDGLGELVNDAIVQPYLLGQISLAEARLAWLRRSPSYFVENLPPVQAHHGLQDTQVDPTHTQILLDALAARGVPAEAAQGLFYPSGQHGLNSLVGQGPVVEPFLCGVNDGPIGYCGPMTAHGAGGIAGLDYAGTTQLSKHDFRIRVNGCLPNSAGLFFVAPGTSYTPSGAGFLCLGQGFQRLGLTLIDGAGFGQLPLDLPSAPIGAQTLIGSTGTVYFQFVFRDFGNPNGAWNFTNGLQVSFEP